MGAAHRGEDGSKRGRRQRPRRDYATSTRPFRGREAIEKGLVTRHGLQTRHRTVLPGVHLRNEVALTPFAKARALWLWGGEQIVLSGVSAAAVWGAKWLTDEDPAECVHPQGRRLRKYPQVRIHRGRLRADDIRRRHGMLATSPARTGFDIGRRCGIGRDGGIGRAVELVDALYQTDRLRKSELAEYARRHRGERGVRRLDRVIDLSDEGAESPWETMLRLVIIGAGFPRPETQIDVYRSDGVLIGWVDLGWRRWRLLVDYEGDPHSDDDQVSRDARRGNRLGRRGLRWIRVRADQLEPDGLAELLVQIRDGLIEGGAPADALPSVAELAAFAERVSTDGFVV